MAVTITGKVFHDTNHNGRYEPGEPGIPMVFLVLYGPDGCRATQTDSNGDYSFSVNTAGVYSIYETAVDSQGSCPPGTFAQPAGFFLSNGPRERTVFIENSQINAGATIEDNNFSHDDLMDPYDCTTQMVQFAGRPTNRYLIQMVTGDFQNQGPLSPPDNVNGVGYNGLDNYIYGYDQTTNNIVRITQSRLLMTLSPRPEGLPVSAFDVGTMDLNGFLYLYTSNGGRFYTVDLRDNSPTFMKLVDPLNGYAEQTSDYGTPLSTPVSIGDWGYHAGDHALYGVERNGVVVRIPLWGGPVEYLETNGPNPGSPFGAAAVDYTGKLYAISDGDGTVYKYTVDGNTARGVRFTSTNSSTQNDGTMCPYAEILVDYGDAPDAGGGGGIGNYNTLQASNGPRHELGTPLYLGFQVTAEDDAYQNADATGDDLGKGIQDDGLITPLHAISTSDRSYTMDVTVTNQTGVRANLYGWIDFNKNGLFEVEEFAFANVPSNSGTQVVTLNFNVPANVALIPDHTFVRLRITTDTLAPGDGLQDGRSVGPASDGEVEDYILGITSSADMMIVKTGQPPVANTGDLMTYTVEIRNNGPDAALDVVLEDVLPEGIENPQFSLDGGGTWDTWSGNWTFGTMEAGEIITVIIQGTFTGSAQPELVNTATVTTTSDDGNEDNNTSTVVTPINRSADVSVTKTTDQLYATPGQLLVYTLRIVNNGPDAAENVLVTDMIPEKLYDVEFSVDGGIQWNPWNGQYDLGTVGPNHSVEIILRGMVETTASGDIFNEVHADSPTPDPDGTNNSDTVIIPVEEAADISVIKTADTDFINEGGTLIYTILISNDGPSTAENVRLTDAVPPQLENVEFSVDGQSTWYPWNGFYAIGTMDVGKVQSVFIRGNVRLGISGVISNTAVVDSDTADPNGDNNVSTSEVEAQRSADLEIVKTADLDSVTSGDLLTFTLKVTNHGPGEAEGVEIIDAISGLLYNVEFSEEGQGGWVPWINPYLMGTLQALESRTLTIRGRVSPSALGIIRNTATVVSQTPDPDRDNNSSETETPVNPTADVTVVKLGPTSVTAGEQVEFVLVLSNSGPSDAVNVVLEDIMPSYIHGAQFSTDNGNSWNVWENRFEAGTLVPGSLVTVLIRGTVAASAVGIIENTARISSDTEDPDLSNNDSAISVDVTTSADIQITKAGSPKPVETGGVLVYQITVNNAGPSDAQEVVVTDSIPSSLENVQYSLDYGNIWMAWNGSYTFTSIAAGTEESLLIRGTVSPTASGVIENTVRADSATPDPDSGNNFAVDETGIHTMADLTITKSGAPVPAVRGETLVYTLTITNLGPDMAENIVLTDDIPGDLEQPQFSTDGGNTWADWTSTYTIDTDLLPGETITVLIRGTVTQTSGPMIENTANVSSTTPDPDLSNNTVQEKTPVGQAADLSVLKTFESNRAVPGEQVIYNLAVSNSGPDSAQDVVLMDTLQQILKEPEFSLDGGTTWQAWPGSYNIGTLNVNATVNVQIRGYIPASHEGILINTASVESVTEDPVEDNNTSKVEMDVTPSADLELTKTVDNSSPLPGSDVIFTIHITNHGPSDAKDVVLIDPVSVQLLQVMYSTDGVNYMPWSSPHAIGNIPANETAAVWIRGTVSPSATGRIANTADAESRTEDPNADNNQDTVILEVSESADLSVAKLAVPRPVEPGAMITYTVIISNAGPAAARSVQMTDELPHNITGGEYSVDLGKSWSSWNGTYSAGDLEAGSEAVVLIRGKVSSEAQGILSNTAAVESTTNDPDLDNNHFTVITEINAAADLSITKAASPVPALNGKFLTYTLTAKNAGPSEAKNVVISDRVSDAEYSLDDGKTWEQWNGFYDAGTLAAGAQLRLRIRKIVNVQENGLISNTALITSTTPDPNPENNRFTIQTPAYAFSELFITKKAYPECAVACRELIYCITVSNRSSFEAERTILTDYVPRQLCHVKYSSDGGATWKPWNGTYHLGSLPAASTVQILISGFVESCACGRIVNTAAVSSLLPGSNPLDRVAAVETRIRRR